MRNRKRFGLGRAVAGVISITACGSAVFGQTITSVGVRLLASDRQNGDGFGVDVAISGSVAVVGAPQGDGYYSNSGAAYVYRESGAGWIEEDILSNDHGAINASGSERFGTSVAVDGDVVVVGAPNRQTSVGAAYVYRYQALAGQWNLEASLTAPSPGSSQWFGTAVAISDDLIAVGAPGAAKVHLFRHSGGAWLFEATLSPGSASQFGASVSVDGGVVLVGAWGYAGKGAVFVAQNSGGWILSSAITPLSAAPSAQFGYDVALHGDLAIIGAPHDNAGSNDSGAAYVLESVTTSPTLGPKLTAFGGGVTGEAFGYTVDVWQNRVIVGAYLSTHSALSQAGQAHVFVSNASGWQHDSILRADSSLANSSDYFAYSVAAEQFAILGAQLDDANSTTDQGSAYVIDLGVPVPPGSNPPTAVAGDDLSVRVGDLAFLDGSASFDDNTPSALLDYEWSFQTMPPGSVAVLADAHTPTPHFIADVSGTYEVALVVTDGAGQESLPAFVIVSTDNIAPQANAGEDRLALIGDTVILDGSGSSDPDDVLLTFQWSIVTAPLGSTAMLTNADMPVATFVPDLPGVYELGLEVSDPVGPGAPDTTVITATDAASYVELQLVIASEIQQSLTADQVTTKGNSNALGNFINQAAVAAQEGDTATAIHKLEQAISRTDGCPLRGSPDGNGPGRDWVTDCDAQQSLYDALTAALQALQ